MSNIIPRSRPRSRSFQSAGTTVINANRLTSGPPNVKRILGDLSSEMGSKRYTDLTQKLNRQHIQYGVSKVVKMMETPNAQSKALQANFETVYGEKLIVDGQPSRKLIKMAEENPDLFFRRLLLDDQNFPVVDGLTPESMRPALTSVTYKYLQHYSKNKWVQGFAFTLLLVSGVLTAPMIAAIKKGKKEALEISDEVIQSAVDIALKAAEESGNVTGSIFSKFLEELGIDTSMFPLLSVCCALVVGIIFFLQFVKK